MSYFQMILMFVALTMTSFITLKLRSGNIVPMHCALWAASVVACIASFTGLH